jgi:hypothetical protein
VLLICYLCLCAQLSSNIKYFIRKKMKEDAAWQKIKVIFSGAEVSSISAGFGMVLGSI